MSQKTNRHVDLNAKGSFSFLQVDIDSELQSIESQVDCSRVVDLFKGTDAVKYIKSILLGSRKLKKMFPIYRIINNFAFQTQAVNLS